MSSNPRTDFGPAITGFIVGGCVLFVIMFGIVQYTNHKYAGHSEGSAAESTK